MIPQLFSCAGLLAGTAAAAIGLVFSAQAQAAPAEPRPALGHAKATAATAPSAAVQAPGAATGAQAAPLPAAGMSAPLAQELRYRVQSPQVRELQVRLRLAKYLALYDVDDRFGMVTREAVVKFQGDNGLAATGIVNSQTWDALLARTRPPTAAELNNTDIGPWFAAPQQAGYMMEVQHRLRQAGLYQGAVDGAFNTATRQAIGAWRTRVGLPVSEVMDERTWTPLLRQTRTPRYAQLFDAPPASTLVQELDPRCTAGKAEDRLHNGRTSGFRGPDTLWRVPWTPLLGV